MKTSFLSSLSLLLLFSCSNDSSLDAQIEYIEPVCLQQLILDALPFGPTTPRANVEKYLFNGQEVFLLNFNNGFPDGQSIVVNSQCEFLCALGGFDGSANDCENFENAVFIETVWTDPR